MVKCQVCAQIEGRRKRALFPNSTTSKNMLGSKNAKKQGQSMLWGNIKFFYKVTTCKEWTSFLQLGKKHVANMMVVRGFVEERTKEYLLFVVIF